MSTNDLMVIAAGLAVIGWINWYFFIARGGVARAAVGASGRQDVTIAVAGGYDPATVHVRRGTPVRLTFDRRESSGCSEEVVIPDLGIRRFLPAHEKTAVEFTPTAAGTVEFTCGMGMLRGRIVVEEGSGS
jgi:plastocyanin domain-containing protein